ncbi:MAG: hypothetical protein IKD69_08430 [Solobacterium sp.]|nr:hypothetical protein [Solobacterium sp.]
MAKKTAAPTTAEVRAYRRQRKAEMDDRIKNHKTFVIKGPSFPGESIWTCLITLPLLEAAEETGTVDTVLKMMGTYLPPFSEKYRAGIFDITGYYDCLALLSLSDYRKEDCEKQLWMTVHQFLAHQLYDAPLLRNMRVLAPIRPSLLPMKECIEAQMKQLKYE